MTEINSLGIKLFTVFNSLVFISSTSNITLDSKLDAADRIFLFYFYLSSFSMAV